MTVVSDQESGGHHGWKGQDLYGWTHCSGSIAASAMGVLGQHIDNLTPPPSSIFQIWHWHSQFCCHGHTDFVFTLLLHPSCLER
jgi:hypothetical protein